MIAGPIDLIFYENINVFIFKKIKIPKSYIQFLYSNLFFYIKNENWIQIQIQSESSFWVVGPQKTENIYKIHFFFTQAKQTLNHHLLGLDNVYYFLIKNYV